MRHLCYQNLLDTGFRHSTGSILYGISYDYKQRDCCELPTVLIINYLLYQVYSSVTCGETVSNDLGRAEPGLRQLAIVPNAQELVSRCPFRPAAFEPSPARSLEYCVTIQNQNCRRNESLAQSAPDSGMMRLLTWLLSVPAGARLSRIRCHSSPRNPDGRMCQGLGEIDKANLVKPDNLKKPTKSARFVTFVVSSQRMPSSLNTSSIPTRRRRSALLHVNVNHIVFNSKLTVLYSHVLISMTR